MKIGKKNPKFYDKCAEQLRIAIIGHFKGNNVATLQRRATVSESDGMEPNDERELKCVVAVMRHRPGRRKMYRDMNINVPKNVPKNGNLKYTVLYYIP